MAVLKPYLEIGPLFEEHWTGIPAVVAGLAQQALADPELDWSFLFETLEVPRAVLEQFLRQRSGAGGLQILSELAWRNAPLSTEAAGRAVCVFPNIKPVRRYFAREAMIVHDLSPILTPQYHNSDNISHFANRIREDVETSDHLFCVSQATSSDVATYFGVPDERLSIIRLGADFDFVHLSAARAPALAGSRCEPYVIVVGTLEPRKNGRLVFEFLMEDPGFAGRYRFVFVGRDGWLGERQRLLRLLAEAGVAKDRVLFSGFVSEADKVALMVNAAFCIYPSFFEGFGLPILEAAALGKISVASNSSSMPEVVPASCMFFDPEDVFDFRRAVYAAELRAAQTRSAARAVPEMELHAAAFATARSYPAVAEWVKRQ